MIEPETDKARSRRLRRMIIRKVVLLAVLIVLMGGYSAYQNGYAVLVGGVLSPETTSGTMASLTCTYFTGTEKVISHVMRPSSDSGRSSYCPVFTKLPKPGPFADDMNIPLPHQPLPGPEAAPAVPATPTPEPTPAPIPAPAQN